MYPHVASLETRVKRDVDRGTSGVRHERVWCPPNAGRSMLPTTTPSKRTRYSNVASKISTSRSGGFAIGTPSAPTVNNRHKVGTRIPEKRWCPENIWAI